MKKNNYISIFAIAIFGALILMITNGMTFTGITVYDESLIEHFSWSKSTLKFRDFINLGCAALIIPLVGAIIDKYGVKVSFTFGLLMLSACYYTYSYIGSATHMYLIHVAFAFAVAASGTLAVIIMVSERVSENRGSAIGIALAGTSLGGIFIPKVAGFLLEKYEWRMAFRYEAMLPLILLIFVWLFIKNKDRFQNNGHNKTDDLIEIDFLSAVKTRTFWFLAAIGFFSYYAILGLMGNLFLYMRELDFSADTAISSLGLMSFIILIAKLLSGVLTDYIDKYTIFKVQLFIMLLGSVGFALYDTTIVWVAIPLMAIGWGGLYTLINYVLITTFGVNSAGKIGGTISTFESLGAGLGVWLSGLIADQSGSYAMSFTVVSSFLFLAFILSLFLKPIRTD